MFCSPVILLSLVAMRLKPVYAGEDSADAARHPRAIFTADKDMEAGTNAKKECMARYGVSLYVTRVVYPPDGLQNPDYLIFEGTKGKSTWCRKLDNEIVSDCSGPRKYNCLDDTGRLSKDVTDYLAKDDLVAFVDCNDLLEPNIHEARQREWYCHSVNDTTASFFLCGSVHNMGQDCVHYQHTKLAEMTAEIRGRFGHDPKLVDGLNPDDEGPFEEDFSSANAFNLRRWDLDWQRSRYGATVYERSDRPGRPRQPAGGDWVHANLPDGRRVSCRDVGELHVPVRLWPGAANCTAPLDRVGTSELAGDALRGAERQRDTCSLFRSVPPSSATVSFLCGPDGGAELYACDRLVGSIMVGCNLVELVPEEPASLPPQVEDRQSHPVEPHSVEALKDVSWKGWPGNKPGETRTG
ncbi:hypothetical protein CDD83_7622 [Cordyceps sp. RAO-2017]|nr:hypothetical protein CDD83_7622 [Cordyceps sp. RAO-2017]